MTQEPRTDVPEKIRSISGANKRRHSSGSESEPEEEPSSSEEEQEQTQDTEKGSASAGNAEKAEGGVGKAGAEQPPAAPSAPAAQAAPSKAPCQPAVFVPVDRSPEMQVRLCEQLCLSERWRGWQFQQLGALRVLVLAAAAGLSFKPVWCSSRKSQFVLGCKHLSLVLHT